MNNRQIQLFEKQKAMYQSLTEDQLIVVDEYHKDDMKKLKKICDPLIFYKGTPKIYHEDLYGVASDVLIESLVSFDPNKECSFKSFFKGNVERAFYEWTRNNCAGKRCNVERDKCGRIKRDGKGKPIVITDISLNWKNEEGVEFGDMLPSDFDLESKIIEEIGISNEGSFGGYSPQMQEYLHKLSNVQRRVLEYLSQGYSPDEIIELLHIDMVLYKDSIAAITSHKNTRILKKCKENRYVR